MLFLALLISNALFFRQLAIWTAGWIYRAAYSGLHGRSVRRKRLRPAAMSTVPARRVAASCPCRVRLMIVKDLRLFRRDPVQWSQFLIFFGLLALYFLNIRRFTYDVPYVAWVNMVSFLNLSVVGLLLSTFTTRFIFPMISLEGRRFWILGLLPVRRETILWGKFLFAMGGSIVPCSRPGLAERRDARRVAAGAAQPSVDLPGALLGAVGHRRGAGGRLPSLREQSPSRIAAGFGGTLNLVISTLYILAVVLLTAAAHPFLLGGETCRRGPRMDASANVRVVAHRLAAGRLGRLSALRHRRHAGAHAHRPALFSESWRFVARFESFAFCDSSPCGPSYGRSHYKSPRPVDTVLARRIVLASELVRLHWGIFPLGGICRA